MFVLEEVLQGGLHKNITKIHDHLQFRMSFLFFKILAVHDRKAFEGYRRSLGLRPQYDKAGKRDREINFGPYPRLGNLL
jgi:hypothetical protein